MENQFNTEMPELLIKNINARLSGLQSDQPITVQINSVKNRFFLETAQGEDITAICQPLKLTEFIQYLEGFEQALDLVGFAADDTFQHILNMDNENVKEFLHSDLSSDWISGLYSNVGYEPDIEIERYMLDQYLLKIDGEEYRYDNKQDAEQDKKTFEERLPGIAR